MSAFEKLCKGNKVGVIDIDVLIEASDIYDNLRLSGELIGDADILIAAFCVVRGYTLVTNNIRHFKRIDGLKFTNWAE